MTIFEEKERIKEQQNVCNTKMIIIAKSIQNATVKNIFYNKTLKTKARSHFTKPQLKFCSISLTLKYKTFITESFLLFSFT